jgi:hypothetical protein
LLIRPPGAVNSGVRAGDGAKVTGRRARSVDPVGQKVGPIPWAVGGVGGRSGGGLYQIAGSSIQWTERIRPGSDRGADRPVPFEGEAPPRLSGRTQ